MPYWKKQPQCFGMYHHEWTLCREQCNWADKCRASKRSGGVSHGTKPRKSGNSTHDLVVEETLNWNRSQSRKLGIDYPESKVPKHLRQDKSEWRMPKRPKPKPKPKPKERVFHMGPPPGARLVYGHITDTSMALMLGINHFKKAIGNYTPTELADAWDKLGEEQDEWVREGRRQIIRHMAFKYFKTIKDFEEFIVS